MIKPVRVLLGGSLRHQPGAVNGELDVTIPGPTRAGAVLALLNIPPQMARIILLNHGKAGLGAIVKPGDRLAVFPPELAFNMYVALELAHNE